MKNPLLKKILPHFIAVVIFLIVSILFCKPVLEGNVLNQHDTVGWKGMAQNRLNTKRKMVISLYGTRIYLAVCPTTGSPWKENLFA